MGMLEGVLLVALAEALVRISLAHPTQSLLKRDTTPFVQASNYYYWMEAHLGSPPQKVEGFVDTGSSDFWVAAPETCNTNAAGQLVFGTLEINCNYTFNASDSSTLTRSAASQNFAASYVSGKGASGFYGQDILNLDGSELKGINFAVATSATGSPVMGISYKYGESCVAWTDSLELADSSCVPYDNLPIQLKQQGLISTVSYSIWLNDVNNGTGSILFGGVDHALYKGNYLTKVPVEKEVYSFDHSTGEIREYPEYTKLLVALTGISVQDHTGFREQIMSGAIPAMLDSGTPDCMVPGSIVHAFYKVFGIYHPDNTNSQSIGCGIPANCSIIFDFRGYEVSVALEQFIRPLLSAGQEMFDSNGNMLCSPGVETLDNTIYAIIGHNVLTSMLTVFDLEANEVAMAAAEYYPTTNSIQNITDGIPSATLAPNYSQQLSLALSVTSSPKMGLTFSEAASVSGDASHPQATITDSSVFSSATFSSAVSGGLSGFQSSSLTLSSATTGTSSPQSETPASSGPTSNRNNASKLLANNYLYALIYIL